jgi:hypothetical protein
MALRPMKAPILLAFLGLATVQAAEPTGTLTLACNGLEIREDGRKTSDQVNIGVILYFQEKSVFGFLNTNLFINDITETTISFAGGVEGWLMNGTLDRVTGMLTANASTVKGKPIASISYDLKCKPTQRMF